MAPKANVGTAMSFRSRVDASTHNSTTLAPPLSNEPEDNSSNDEDSPSDSSGGVNLAGVTSSDDGDSPNDSSGGVSLSTVLKSSVQIESERLLAGEHRTPSHFAQSNGLTGFYKSPAQIVRERRSAGEPMIPLEGVIRTPLQIEQDRRLAGLHETIPDPRWDHTRWTKKDRQDYAEAHPHWRSPLKRPTLLNRLRPMSGAAALIAYPRVEHWSPHGGRNGYRWEWDAIVVRRSDVDNTIYQIVNGPNNTTSYGTASAADWRPRLRLQPEARDPSTMSYMENIHTFSGTWFEKFERKRKRECCSRVRDWFRRANGNYQDEIFIDLYAQGGVSPLTS